MVARAAKTADNPGQEQTAQWLGRHVRTSGLQRLIVIENGGPLLRGSLCVSALAEHEPVSGHAQR